MARLTSILGLVLAALATGTSAAWAEGVAQVAARATTDAAADRATSTWSSIQLPGTQQLDLMARAGGHRYRIFLSVPPGPAPAAGHPVLYVLDGNAAFPVAAFLSRAAARYSEVSGHLAPVVVGIGYPGDADFDVAARKRDYTVGATRPELAASEGGADRFLDFIEHELKPLIAAKHPIDPKRQALFGHSFGGLFVLNTLFTRPQAFTTYLASSPSIWWNNRRVLAALPALEKLQPQAEGRPLPRVQVSVGALEDDPPKGKYSPEKLAMHAARPMVSEARSVSARLKALPGWSEQVIYHELAGEDHGTVWLPALSRGMQHLLEQP
jgi:uncharacterized protein